MKDLDFDELDQAVSSVLGANAEPKKDDAPADVPVPAAVKSEPEQPKVADKPAQEKTDDKPAATPVASPAVRRRGQFLDMVHPSADMTSRLPITSPAARKQLTPVSTDVSNLKPASAPTPAEVNKVESDTMPAATEAVPSPEKTDVTPPSTPDKPAEEPEKSGSDVKWPDPLDLELPAEPEIPATVPDHPAELDAPDEKPAEPATTPFVPDVKVDKRPLGGPGAQSAETSSDATAEETPAPPVETVTEEAKTPAVTPPELQPEVVSVEAAADREFAPDGTDTETTEEASKGMAQSIPQQYHTPAEKPDTEAHPVFDTKEYHQPLLPAHGKKKSKSWLVVLIIVALLVVGAGLGYVAYMAGL